MTKMNPEIKAKWVAALRSGEYKQADGALVKHGRHCCLGVMCDLYAKEHGISEWSEDTLGRDGDAFPDDVVCEWAGLPVSADGERYNRDYNPGVKIGGAERSLSDHNDAGATFAEIADAIEAQL